MFDNMWLDYMCDEEHCYWGRFNLLTLLSRESSSIFLLLCSGFMAVTNSVTLVMVF